MKLGVAHGFRPLSIGTQFLTDNFATPPLALSLTKEVESYSGPCFRVRNVATTVQTDIGWNGKEADAAALTAAISGSTGRVVTWYDQSGNANHAQQATTTRQWQATVVGGKVKFAATSTAQGMEVAAHASIQPAHPNLYFIHNPGFFDADTFATYIGYSATGTFASVARWGLQFESVPGSYGPGLRLIRNAASADFVDANVGDFSLGQVFFGGADGSSPMIWNHLPHASEFRAYEGYLGYDGGANTNVTYTGSPTLIIGNNRAYTQGISGHVFCAVILYDDANVLTDRDAITTYLGSAASHDIEPIEWTRTDAQGFVWTADVKPRYTADPTDEQGMDWSHEHGGYIWSRAKATTSNSTAFYEFQVRPGDYNFLTAEERSEGGGSDPDIGEFAGGNTYEIYTVIRVLEGDGTGGGWCLGMQFHYSNFNLVPATPDLLYVDFSGGQFQWNRQKDGNDGIPIGSAVAYTLGVNYAVRIKVFWSTNGTSDTAEIWMGPHGGTLTKIVDVSGALFEPDQDTQAFQKFGVYASSLSAPFRIQHASYQTSVAANAYAAYVTTQPALPTHA